jgi:transposase InsO family protein
VKAALETRIKEICQSVCASAISAFTCCCALDGLATAQQDAQTPVQGQAAGGSHDREAAERARIRVDQGTEFVARDLDLWADTRGVTLDFSGASQPTVRSWKPSMDASVRSA